MIILFMVSNFYFWLDIKENTTKKEGDEQRERVGGGKDVEYYGRNAHE